MIGSPSSRASSSCRSLSSLENLLKSLEPEVAGAAFELEPGAQGFRYMEQCDFCDTSHLQAPLVLY